jgi:hypothetical protein
MNSEPFAQMVAYLMTLAGKPLNTLPVEAKATEQ